MQVELGADGKERIEFKLYGDTISDMWGMAFQSRT